jgi:serine/threonine protein phosphatase PrpC
LQILESTKPKDTDNEEEQSLDTVGCTANVIYMDKEANKIYVVNAGDSRCTMGRAGVAVEMSIDHKPES